MECSEERNRNWWLIISILNTKWQPTTWCSRDPRDGGHVVGSWDIRSTSAKPRLYQFVTLPGSFMLRPSHPPSHSETGTEGATKFSPITSSIHTHSYLPIIPPSITCRTITLEASRPPTNRHPRVIEGGLVKYLLKQLMAVNRLEARKINNNNNQS